MFSRRSLRNRSHRLRSQTMHKGLLWIPLIFALFVGDALRLQQAVAATELAQAGGNSDAARHQAEEAQRRQAEEQRRQAEEAQRRQAEEQRRQTEDAQRRQAEERRRQTEDAQRRQAEERRRQAQEAQRRQAEERRRQAEEEETLRTRYGCIIAERLTDSRYRLVCGAQSVVVRCS